jgi:hypothetical protein
MSTYRYPGESLAMDYARGIAGLVLTGAPLAALDPHWAVSLLLAGACATFGVFVLRTAQRHLTVFEVGDQGIVARGPLGGAIAWPELSDLTLRYYSTRRDRGRGWMQMTLRGSGRKLTLESSLSGFDDIAERAAAAARRNGLTLRETTLSNLVALGIAETPPATDPTP